MTQPLLGTEMGYFQVTFPGPGDNIERLRVPEKGVLVTPAEERVVRFGMYGLEQINRQMIVGRGGETVRCFPGIIRFLKWDWVGRLSESTDNLTM